MQRIFDCAGIESPGLTSAPAIGELVAELVSAHLHAKKKEHFVEKEKDLWIRKTFQRRVSGTDPEKSGLRQYDLPVRDGDGRGNRGSYSPPDPGKVS